MTRYYADLPPEAKKDFESLLDLGLSRQGLADLFDLSFATPPRQAPPPRQATVPIRPRQEYASQGIETWVDLISEAIDWCEEVPEPGYDFAHSVQDKLESIQEQVVDKGSITPAQESAIINMREGLKKWLR